MIQPNSAAKARRTKTQDVVFTDDQLGTKDLLLHMAALL